ncbi:MAG TPA: VanZ family protein [Pyrinomonadaceae bacterium]|nr:VanZ family protein [Pyrinomonadaceae bacterium]
MLIISLASTGGFSADNTSRIIRPLLLWLFPNLTEPNIQLAHLIVRKLAHLTEYAILGWLAARAFVTSSLEFLRRYWFLAGLVLVVFQAAMDEYHQSFLATRTGSPYDSLIDIVGGLLALLLFAYLQRRSLFSRPALCNIDDGA